MKRSFYPKPFFLALIIGLFILSTAFFGGCDQNQPSKPHVDTLSRMPVLGNFLDTLMVDSGSFGRINRNTRLVLQFRIGGKDSLTLDGWSAPKDYKDPFSGPANIHLLKYKADKIQKIEPGMFLGNQVLHQIDIKHIQDYMRHKKTPFLLFVPEKYPSGHIYYKVFLSKQKLDSKVVLPFNAIIDAGASLNPSPPKSYSDN